MGVGAALVFSVLTAHVLALSATGVLPRPLLSLPGLGKSFFLQVNSNTVFLLYFSHLYDLCKEITKERFDVSVI